jgi:hypothetical protein
MRPVLELIVAMAVLALFHVPPAVASAKAEVLPAHIAMVPVMGWGD